MSGIWKKLAEQNFQTILKTAGAGHTIEIRDENLKLVAHVKDNHNRTSTLDVEAMGLIYSDGDNKFYSEMGEEISKSELTDMLVEAHLNAVASPMNVCESCGGRVSLGQDGSLTCVECGHSTGPRSVMETPTPPAFPEPMPVPGPAGFAPRLVSMNGLEDKSEGEDQ